MYINRYIYIDIDIYIYIQYPVINHNGKEYEKNIYLNHFAIYQKLTQL